MFYKGRAIVCGLMESASKNTIMRDAYLPLEFDNFYMVTVYTPNSQNELARLPFYRMKWEDDFLGYLKNLEKTKPVIFCGDLNVAHKEIDLKNPKTNRKNAGFTDEETGEVYKNGSKRRIHRYLPLFLPRSRKAFIPGGPIGFKAQEKRTQDGVLIISAYPKV
ncbi:MAG: endonuclease/exonuclease/phosphatase family protein [Lachnospiraceae bacterium]